MSWALVKMRMKLKLKMKLKTKLKTSLAGLGAPQRVVQPCLEEQ
jgi:hypothetical protein